MADDAIFELLYMEISNSIACGDSPQDLDAAVTKLEHMGFQTGYRLVERITFNMPRFKYDLDIVKFICKEFWTCVFKKQIDNLRTNHQGVYVLMDNRFRFLSRLSSGKQYLEVAPKYLAFTSGMIRGALANLGVTSVVTYDVAQLPACRFQITAQPQ